MVKGDLNGQRGDDPKTGTVREPKCFFEESYRLCYPQVVRQLTYLLGSRAAAEDVAQETFLKLYTVPPPTRDNLAGWLNRVGARLAFNYLRGEKRRVQREQRVDPTGGDVIPLDDHLWRDEQVKVVRELLAELPDRDRLALLLRHTGFTYQEIAQVIGVAPGSMGTLLVRAQRCFGDKYKERMRDDYELLP